MRELHQKRRKEIDNMILGTICILFAGGSIFLFSALLAESHWLGLGVVWTGMLSHFIAFILGFILLTVVSQIDSNVYLKYFHFIGALSIPIMGLLLTPLAIEANGAVRWIDLGFISFQPSEYVKLAAVIFFAALFSQKLKHFSFKKISCFAVAGLIFLFTVTVMQPDFGTTMLIFTAIIAMLIVSGFPLRLKIAALGMVVVLGMSLMFFVPEYVNTRLAVFYDVNFGTISEIDRYGSAYHTLQNLESVEQGGFFGNGLQSFARTTQYKIPEISTDSIFALVASESGFLGSVTIILIFLFLCFLFLSAAHQTRDSFGMLLIVGITVLIASQFFVNILVVLGFPATGVPLLFFSRGGSSLLMSLVAVGIIRSILLQAKRISI